MNKKYVLAFAFGIVTTVTASIPHDETAIKPASDLVESASTVSNEESLAAIITIEKIETDLQTIVEEVTCFIEATIEELQAMGIDTTNFVVGSEIEHDGKKYIVKATVDSADISEVSSK